MLNTVRMELFRMFRTRSMYVIWICMAVGIIFTTSLSAADMKNYSMEDKKELYEYATGQQDAENLNLGMDVTTPTKPGEDVSVFDLFFANLKGKFIALFMVIFTVMYSTADMTSGFVKNIAGQLRDRRVLIYAKACALFVYTVLTLFLFAGIQAVSNGIFFDKFVWGPAREFAVYAGIQILLHFALLLIIMCLAIIIRNNAVSMVAAICMTMNVLVIAYGVIDKIAAKFGVSDFHFLEYTVTGRISMLGMDVTAKAGGTAAAVGAVFIIACVILGSTVFKQRDI